MTCIIGGTVLTSLYTQKLVFSFSETNFEVNIGVLETAHSIFRPWRAETRSDVLFTVINYVLSRFTRPFLQLFLHTTTLLFSSPPPANLAQIAQAMVFSVDIFYDLTCQDLPPDIEDAHAQFFCAESGLFLKLLMWDPAELRGDVSVLSCLCKARCDQRNWLKLTHFCSPMIPRRRCRHRSRRASLRLSRSVKRVYYLK